MKKRALTLLMFTFSALAMIPAQETGEVSFPKLKGWKLNVSSDVYLPDNLWDLINGAAESYLSYDFVDLHLADYENKKGLVIHAEIYRHSSLDNAFGIYSSERSPEYNFLEIGTQGYSDDGVLNFFTGPFYVKLYSTGSSPGLKEFLEDIGNAVSRHLGQDDGWPALLMAFPGDEKLTNRDHYIGENFIGLNFLHSTFTAEYEGGYKLFVIEAENSKEVLEMVRAYLNFTKQDIDPESESSFTLIDKYNGSIPIFLKGKYIAGILDGADNEKAGENFKTLVGNLQK